MFLLLVGFVIVADEVDSGKIKHDIVEQLLFLIVYIF